ncbi:MAG: hypothetical protein ACOC40_02295 [Thermoplasmatota archaeon]
MIWIYLLHIIFPCTGTALTLLGVYLEKRSQGLSMFYDIFGVGLPIFLFFQTLVLFVIFDHPYEIPFLAAAIISFIYGVFLYWVEKKSLRLE